MSEIVKKATGAMKMGKPKPLWLDTVSRLYPPVTFTLPKYIQQAKGKLPRPLKIVFPEDQYRQKFFRENKAELLRPTSMDERVSFSKNAQTILPDSVFEEQIALMENGVDAETAYQQAVKNYNSARRRQEIANRVAQEQALENSSMPASQIIEELLEEERVALSKQSMDIKTSSNATNAQGFNKHV